MSPDNRIVVDLNKVQYGRFHYVNQYGQRRNTLPDKTIPTYRGDVVDRTAFKRAKDSDVKLLLIDDLIARNLLDFWTPQVYFKLQANSSLVYTGEKAVSLWATWNAKQFGKKGKH